MSCHIWLLQQQQQPAEEPLSSFASFFIASQDLLFYMHDAFPNGFFTSSKMGYGCFYRRSCQAQYTRKIQTKQFLNLSTQLSLEF